MRSQVSIGKKLTVGVIGFIGCMAALSFTSVWVISTLGSSLDAAANGTAKRLLSGTRPVSADEDRIAARPGRVRDRLSYSGARPRAISGTVWRAIRRPRPKTPFARWRAAVNPRRCREQVVACSGPRHGKLVELEQGLPRNSAGKDASSGRRYGPGGRYAGRQRTQGTSSMELLPCVAPKRTAAYQRSGQ